LGQYANTKINKCASCRKVLKDNQITYCSDICKTMKDERNAKSNGRNNFKKKIKKLVSKPSLFDVMALVKLTEQQMEWIGK
jgi:Fe-S-cluster-containing dehydrogenase component